MLTEIKLKQIYTDGTRLFRGVGWIEERKVELQIVYEEVVPFERWIGTNSYGGMLTSVKKVKGNKLYRMGIFEFTSMMSDPTRELVQGIIQEQNKAEEAARANP